MVYKLTSLALLAFQQGLKKNEEEKIHIKPALANQLQEQRCSNPGFALHKMPLCALHQNVQAPPRSQRYLYLRQHTSVADQLYLWGTFAMSHSNTASLKIPFSYTPLCALKTVCKHKSYLGAHICHDVWAVHGRQRRRHLDPCVGDIFGPHTFRGP